MKTYPLMGCYRVLEKEETVDIPTTFHMGLRIFCSHSFLKRILRSGPNSSGDDYKVTTKWILESNTGDIVTIYDWKATDKYDSNLLIPYDKIEEATMMFYIGGNSYLAAKNLCNWLEKKLKKEEGAQQMGAEIKELWHPWKNNLSVTKKEEKKMEQVLPTEQVNSPKHYNQGKIETIEIIEDLGMGPDFCAGNVIKYVSRHKHKGTPLQDLKKAEWYLQRLITNMEKEEGVEK